MSKTPPSAETIDEAAVRWFTILQDEAVTAKQRRAFARWRARDPAHDAAYTAVEATWRELDALGGGKLEELLSRRRTLKKLAFIGLAGTGLGTGWALSPPGLFADHRTGTGERRTVVLPDGTRVELGPLTALSLGDWTTRRLVHLERGEIFVTVAPERERAFVVVALRGESQARGTAFNVKLDAGTVEVATREGVVDVNSGRGAVATLRVAEAVSYDAGGLSTVQPADLVAVEAWRAGRLVFNNAPLPRVAREFERYLPGRIILLGRASERRVTAAFETERPEQALALIADTFRLTVRRWTPWLTIVTAAG